MGNDPQKLRELSPANETRNRVTRWGRCSALGRIGGLLLTSVAVCGITVSTARAEKAIARGKLDTAAGDRALSEGSADVAEIQVWWPLGGAFGQAFEKQVRRFNESQNRIIVEVKVLNGYEAIHKELTQAFENGNLPDLAIIEVHNIPNFAADGRILNLDPLIANDATFRPDDLLPGILTNLRYHDRLYAIPMNRSTPLLYYNMDRFKAAGLDPTKPPETWQQLREMSVALTPQDRRDYGFVAVNSAWFFESLVWSNGGQLIVDGKATFAEFGAAPLQLWADMVHLDNTARFAKGGGGEFTSGRAAMIVDSTSLLQHYTSQAQFKVGTAFLPRSEGFEHAVATGGGGAVIPASISPERQAAAWEFVTWFIGTNQTADWSAATGYIPIRESARALLQSKGFYAEHPQFEVAIKQLKYAREAPQQPQWGDVWKIISDSMTLVVRDDLPALRILKEAEKKVDVAIAPKVAPAP